MRKNFESAMWVGQAEVVPLPGNVLFNAPALGGFIAAAAYAADADEFAHKVTRELEEYGVSVKEVSGIERLANVLLQKPIEDRLAAALETLKPDAVALGSLFTFQTDDEKV